ncbi:hypothetical protein [Limosilactobacillus vaginalis]|uniref:hypothetical protein n=1 Tax=Limosilactobacillus vaginalis TaxID=1633 RepID=UPI00242F78D6|nr:hypothetical protein [Limosilactobacillus vaginalis]MCI6853249.1 hypothetical protein [Limosilactobacillus vaginalis]
MKKFSRLFLSGMLVTILGFGLAGCGSQKNSKDTASSSHTKTEKVTKKATKKTSKNSKQNSTKKKTSSTSSSASVTSSSQSSSSTANSNVNNNSQKQLGLNDVAVWTDQYGVTHHVDSDGMDRQTIAGSSQTNYQDWSGSLPSNAQIVKQN